MRKRSLAMGLAISVLALSSAPVCAQVAPLANAAGIAVQQKPHTTLSVEAAALFDNNIARSSDTVIAQRKLLKDDFRVTPSAVADIYRPIGNSYVSLNGRVGYDINVRNTVLNRERIDLTAGAGTHAGPCAVAASGGYARRQSDLGELAILTQGGNATVKNTETITSISGTLACGGQFGLRALALGGYSDSRNSSVARTGSSNHATTYGAGLEFLQPAIGQIRVYAVERDIDFFRRDNVNYFGAPRLVNRAGTVSFARDIGARLSGSFALTYAEAKARGVAAGDNFSGLLWDVALNLRASSRLKLALSASRSVDPSQGFNVDYIVGEDYRIQATYAVNDRQALVLSAEHRKQNYHYTSIANLIPAYDRSANLIDGSYKINAGRRMRFSIDAGYLKADSDSALYRFDSVHGGVSAAIDFQ